MKDIVDYWKERISWIIFAQPEHITPMHQDEKIMKMLDNMVEEIEQYYARDTA